MMLYEYEELMPEITLEEIINAKSFDGEDEPLFYISIDNNPPKYMYRSEIINSRG